MKYIIEIDIPEESIARYREVFADAAAQLPDDEFCDRVLDAVIGAIGPMVLRHGHEFDQRISAPTMLNSYVIRKMAAS